MKIKGLSVILALFVTVSAYADDDIVGHHYSRDCRNDGGVPIEMRLVIDGGGAFTLSGDSHKMCLFSDSTGSRLEYISSSTLSSSNPSLAATAYRDAPVINIPANAPRYDVYYCQHLGGTVTIGEGLSGGFAENADASETSVCVFPDGSMIDTWSLYYKRMSNNPAVDLTPYFRSSVLPIAPSVLWGSSNSN